jgi:hypothetical protein
MLDPLGSGQTGSDGFWTDVTTNSQEVKLMNDKRLFADLERDRIERIAGYSLSMDCDFYFPNSDRQESASIAGLTSRKAPATDDVRIMSI